MAYCKFDSGDVWMHTIPGVGVQCHWCRMATKKLVVRQGTHHMPYLSLAKRPPVKKVLHKMPRYRQLKSKMHPIGIMLIREPVFASYQSALDHLKSHRIQGQKVPQFAIDFLESDITDGKPIKQSRSRRFVMDREHRQKPSKRTRKTMHQAAFK